MGCDSMIMFMGFWIQKRDDSNVATRVDFGVASFFKLF